MTKVLITIADGSEELECVTATDLMRRAGADVTVASVMTRPQVTASRGVVLTADTTIQQLSDDYWDLIILPGGMPGAEHLGRSQRLMELILKQMQAQRWLAAICAAPAVVLGRHGLIKDRRATCYPTFQQELQEQVRELSHDKVVVDQRLVTSLGPGTAMEFSLTLIELLWGHSKRNEIAAQLIY